MWCDAFNLALTCAARSTQTFDIFLSAGVDPLDISLIKGSHMSTVKGFLAAFLLTTVIAVVALLIALVASTSGTSADGNGISAYAGGISESFVTLLGLALPVVFLALFFMFRRTGR